MTIGSITTRPPTVCSLLPAGSRVHPQHASVSLPGGGSGQTGRREGCEQDYSRRGAGTGGGHRDVLVEVMVGEPRIGWFWQMTEQTVRAVQVRSGAWPATGQSRGGRGDYLRDQQKERAEGPGGP